MPHAEKRKKLRRSITYPAFLDLGDGSPALVCTLCDASQEGAQLAVADPKILPDEFILALSADGAARRHCRVVWRTERQIGVEFLKDGKIASTARVPVAPRVSLLHRRVPQPRANRRPLGSMSIRLRRADARSRASHCETDAALTLSHCRQSGMTCAIAARFSWPGT